MLFLHFNPAFKSLCRGDTLDALWLGLYKSRCAVTYLHYPHPALSHASTEWHEWRWECSLRRISRLCRELRAKLHPHLCSQVVFPVFRCVHVPWPGDWRSMQAHFASKEQKNKRNWPKPAHPRSNDLIKVFSLPGLLWFLFCSLTPESLQSVGRAFLRRLKESADLAGLICTDRSCHSRQAPTAKVWSSDSTLEWPSGPRPKIRGSDGTNKSVM